MANQYPLFLTIIRHFSLFHDIFKRRNRCLAEAVISSRANRDYNRAKDQFPAIRSLAHFALMTFFYIGTSIICLYVCMFNRLLLNISLRTRGKGVEKDVPTYRTK
jgi:hypothetical protein